MTAVVALVASLYAGDASAQVLVVAERGLEFGQLTPGTTTTVQPTDVTRRAHLTVQGRGSYDVTFQLPTHLESPAGHAIPLLFGAGSGRVEVRQKVSTFDPADGVDIRINPAEREAAVYLGGQAMTSPGQVAGSYTATIVMIIVQTGN